MFGWGWYIYLVQISEIHRNFGSVCCIVWYICNLNCSFICHTVRDTDNFFRDVSCRLSAGICALFHAQPCGFLAECMMAISGIHVGNQQILCGIRGGRAISTNAYVCEECRLYKRWLTAVFVSACAEIKHSDDCRKHW